jgi:diguanylate cyclase (GGDEF)-like protein/PAS domain S-box-containing protein
VPFLILIILATGLVGYLSYRNEQQAMRNIVHHLRSEIDGRIQDHLRSFLEIPPRINQINANAIRHGWIKADDPNTLEHHFREQLQVYDSVTSIYYGNSKGGLVNAGREGMKGSQYIMVTDGFVKGPLHKYATVNPGNRVKLLANIPFFDATVRPWYISAVKKGDDAWSDIYTLVTGQDMAISASHPVYDEQHNLLGVVSVDIFLSQLSYFLKTLNIGKTGISFIVERSGLMIASSADEKPLPGPSGTGTQKRIDSSESAIPLVRHAVETMVQRFGNYQGINKAQSFDFEIDDQRHFLTVSPFQMNSGLDWLIVTVMPESDFTAQINVDNRNTAFLIGAVLIIVIILCIITAQLITIPILRLNTAAQSLTKGNWDQIRTIHWVRETGDLTLSFNHMVLQLKQTMENLASEIEERKQAEVALRESEEKHRSLLENLPIGLYRNTPGPQGRFIMVNTALARLHGFDSVEEFLSRNVLDLYVDPAQRKEISAELVEKGFVSDKEVMLKRKDGTSIWGSITARAIHDHEGKVVYFDGTVTDITDRKRMEKEILTLSITDQLTGLYNRRGFLSLAGQQLKLSERNKSGMLLFFADLDLLKWINDALGHEEGDKALIEAANIFREAFRTSDIIARLGGDEFAVLAIDIKETNPEVFTARMQQLIDILKNQENRRYNLSISMGCSYYDPENPCSIDELMARADKLMYEQKQNKQGLLTQMASISTGNP